MKTFIKNNWHWLWRIPVNFFTILSGRIPIWLLVACIFIFMIDLIILGIRLQEEF